MTTTTEISLTEARTIAIAAQGLHCPANYATTVLDRLGCIQIDSMAAVRRSHELVGLARGLSVDVVSRLGTAKSEVETFEGWAHALSLIPLQLWPLFAWRRRRVRTHGWSGPEVDLQACVEVLARLRAEGPLTLSDLGGTTGSGWERTSPARWAAEWLEKTGDLVVRHRRSWRRVYAPVEQALPADLLNTDLDDADCTRQLVQIALAALGVATAGDIADYFRIPITSVDTALGELDPPRIAVGGWKEPAWMHNLEAEAEAGSAAEPTPLSPFDSLIWHRPRQLRLFGRNWLLEAYKPAAKRSFGYFGMPILAGTELAGRIAPRRAGGALAIEAVEWEGPKPSRLTRAVETLRRWTETSTIIWPEDTRE